MGKRQQRYLRDQVDPVLKPLIRRALGGSELPPDFKEWIWTQLSVDFGEKKKKSTHSPAPVNTVPDVIHNQNELMKVSKPVFSTLPPVDFESTRGAYAQLCSAAEALEKQYAKDCERQERKKRAAEEARKREEARKLAEEARKREEARRLEVEARKREEEAKRVEADSAKPLRLFMSYARGNETTKFARKVKVYLEAKGFAVWMDEEDIAGGAGDSET